MGGEPIIFYRKLMPPSHFGTASKCYLQCSRQQDRRGRFSRNFLPQLTFIHNQGYFGRDQSMKSF